MKLSKRARVCSIDKRKKTKYRKNLRFLRIESGRWFIKEMIKLQNFSNAGLLEKEVSLDLE